VKVWCKVYKNSGSVFLTLPLPPSTNKRLMPVAQGRYLNMILTKEARGYLSCIGQELCILRKNKGLKPIDDYRVMDMWFVLPTQNCDCHNYFKILFDTMETGGILKNDRYVLPRVQGLWHSKEFAGVTVKL